MKSNSQIVEVFDKLKECRPTHFFKHIDEINSGMGFIMVYLYESKNDVCAIELSKHMQISRARVAMLIKKLIAKGFVEKEDSLNDARKEIVKITDAGIYEIAKMRQQVFNNIAKVVDKLGIDRVLEFIELSKQIHSVIEE